MIDEKKYTIVEKIEESTHFLALIDTRENAHHIYLTPGKIYPFSIDLDERDYVIINDIGKMTMGYIIHRGEYVRYKHT